MSLVGVSTTALSLAHLESLRDNKVAENSYLEYKERIGKSNDEKKKFLAGVSSFANTYGGDFLIGVAANKGIPVDFPGIPLAELDDEKQRLENLLRDGIEPRLRLNDVRDVEVENGARVLVLRIPRSWRSPHRVTLEGHDKFYARNSAGKHQMNVEQLRDAFLLSESFVDRARAFRAERVEKLKAGMTPVLMRDGAKTMIHLVPLGAFQSREEFNFAPAELSNYPTNQRDEWPYMFMKGTTFYNFDGVINSDRDLRDDREVPGRSYSQFRRNGIVEAVTISTLASADKGIPMAFHDQCLDAAHRFMGIAQEMGVQPPVAMMLSLVGVQGFGFQYGSGWPLNRQNCVDREDLLIPEIIIGDFTSDPIVTANAMRPVFDTLWQACNYRRCPYYSQTGEWEPDNIEERIREVLV